MSKNVRISLYILIPIIGWVISGQFIEEEVLEKKSSQELTSVIVEKSDAEFFSPKVILNGLFINIISNVNLIKDKHLSTIFKSFL